ncbi:MAG: response regulator, partial [Actinomycetes bacterium]
MITRHRASAPISRNLAASTAAACDDYPGTPEQPAVAGRCVPNAIRVFLVIDMSLPRGALAALLSSEDDIEVVAGMALGDRVIPTAIRHRPDIVVVDVDQNGPDVLATAHALQERLPECRVIVLATAQRPGLVRRALDVPVAGAVDKDAPPRRLLATIRQVAKGKRTIDPALAVAAIGVAGSPLTPRELTVLDLASGGASPTEIAQRLFLSRGTVCN